MSHLIDTMLRSKCAFISLNTPLRTRTIIVNSGNMVLMEYSILFGKLKGRGHSVDGGVDGRITLKPMFEKLECEEV